MEVVKALRSGGQLVAREEERMEKDDSDVSCSATEWMRYCREGRVEEEQEAATLGNQVFPESRIGQFFGLVEERGSVWA